MNNWNHIDFSTRIGGINAFGAEVKLTADQRVEIAASTGARAAIAEKFGISARYVTNLRCLAKKREKRRQRSESDAQLAKAIDDDLYGEVK